MIEKLRFLLSFSFCWIFLMFEKCWMLQNFFCGFWFLSKSRKHKIVCWFQGRKQNSISWKICVRLIKTTNNMPTPVYCCYSIFWMSVTIRELSILGSKWEIIFFFRIIKKLLKTTKSFTSVVQENFIKR